jgi:CRP/FNR family transcriptional regulator
MEPVTDPAKIELEDRLRKVFPDIYEPEARKALVDQGRYMELRAGEVYMDIGGFIRNVPLVLSGLLKLERMDDEGNELLLYYLKPGETCAMSLTCCMNEARSTIRVTAEEDSELLAIPVRIMDRLTEEHRSWKNFVMLTYQRRFDELLRTIDGVAFQKLDSRIVELLNSRARNSGSSVLSVTHQELAEQLNSSREVVSRLLKRMEREGVLKLGRQRIELLSMHKAR